jgi:ABC-type polysaccharide/polyol phosphate export systems, permease component
MMIEKFREIYNFREMIKSWTRKELRTRYKGSFLGFLWTFINPLLQLMVYSVIFPFIMRFTQEKYAMFLFVALIPWNYFTGTLQGSCNLIVFNSSMVTKVYFPREVLPISFTMSGMYNMVFSYMVVFPMLVIFQIPFTWNLLWLPILILVQSIFNLGIAFLVSSINVYFRDLEYLISIGTMALYFMTPIMYSITDLSERLQAVLMINPMTSFVIMYRDVMFYGKAVDLWLLGYAFTYSVIICVIGYFTFGRLQRKFTEVL